MKFKKKILATVAAMALSAMSAKADITDGKFGTGQMFDVQYYWSQAETPTTPDYSCYGTNNCEVLNASGFTRVYSNSGQLSVQDYTNMQTNNQYFGFFNSTTQPGQHGLAIYNSNGTIARVIHEYGTFTAIGPDAIFYLGSNSNGTVISTTTGYSFGGSGSFTSMDVNVSSTDLTSYTYATTTPLAPGQTASSPPAPTTPTYTAITSANVVQVTPTSNNSPAGEGANNVIDGQSSTKYLNFDRASAGFTIKLDQGRVIEKFTITTANDYSPRDPSKFSLFGSNDGKTWTTIANAQSITLSDNRFTTSSDITVTNTNAYVYYFITFDSTKALDQYSSVSSCEAGFGGGWLGTENCNSVQVSEVKYYYNSASTATSTDTGDGTVANPGTLGATSSLNTAPVITTSRGTSVVAESTVNGTITSTDVITRGTPIAVTVETRERGTQSTKTLAVNRIFTTTTTTPVNTTTTTVTPWTRTTTTTTPVTTNTTVNGVTTSTTTDEVVTTTTTGNTTTTTLNTVVDVQTATVTNTFNTRIDQMDYLEKANQRINMTLDSDVLSRHRGNGETLSTSTNLIGNEEKGWTYLILEGQRSNTSDTYSMNTQRYGVGHEKKIKGNWIVGAQYNYITGTLTGDQAGGSLVKNHVGLYSLYNMNEWLLKSDLGFAQNDFRNYHSINELGYSNSGKTSGQDYWLSNRLYTPDLKGFRPFGGVRVENTSRASFTEAGSALTSMNYNGVNSTNTIGEAGVRYDKKIADKVNVLVEVSQTTNDITTAKIGASFAPTQSAIGSINIGQQRQDSVVNNMVQAMFKWMF